MCDYRGIYNFRGLTKPNIKGRFRTINILSGRKNKSQGLVPAESPSDRLSIWKTHFKNVLAPEVDNNIQLSFPKIFDTDIMFNTSEFSIFELEKVLKSMQNNKACGEDNIPVELLKIPGFIYVLLPILNKALLDGEIPIEWKTQLIIPIPKKGNLSLCDNYRGIALMSIVAKIFNKLLLFRLREALDSRLRVSQNGFRQNRSTIQHILVLRRLLENMEKATEETLFVLFIDFKKAFDSITWPSISAVLKAYSVPDILVTAIMSLYYGANAKVCTSDGISDPFDLSIGVLQGDTLAPYLFILVMDFIMRQAIPDNSNYGFEYTKRNGSRQPSQKIAELLFADDIALISGNIVEMQIMLDNVIKNAKLVGLQINVKKTQWLVAGKEVNTKDTLTVNSVPLEKIDDYKYLGVWIKSTMKEFNVRKALAWEAAKRIKKLWISPTLSEHLKIRVFQTCVESVLLYAGETWSLTKLMEKQLDGTYTKLLRYCLNIKWQDKIPNYILYQNIPPVSLRLKARRMSFAGHCFRSRYTAPQPSMDFILWRYKGQMSRGALNRKTHLKLLCEDSELSTGIKDIDASIISLSIDMRNREKWRDKINEQKL
jgi:hypothetical protein